MRIGFPRFLGFMIRIMQPCQGDLRHGRRCAWSSKQTETAFVGQARFKDFSSFPPGIVGITAMRRSTFLIARRRLQPAFRSQGVSVALRREQHAY
jgi:hypothetical protein